MIAARLTLTSPCARRPIVERTMQPTPEAVSAWANRRLRRFADRLGVSPLACDWDLQQKAEGGKGRAN